MALSREYHRVSEMNRIMRDHLDFLCDVEIEEELTEPAALPKRIIRDRMNPLELRPLEFRVTFGMSKEFFKDLLDLRIGLDSLHYRVILHLLFLLFLLLVA